MTLIEVGIHLTTRISGHTSEINANTLLIIIIIIIIMGICNAISTEWLFVL